ncbi:MAG: HAD hydrolase-like protein [Chitinophagaceae bacterium]|nr:HAD hydrolase-like protein [Chitinophagaceae bacterium]
MSVKLVVFDIAGTTVRDDGSVATAFRNAFVKNGFDISLEDTHPYMGVKKVVAVQMMLDQLGARYTPDDIQKIHADFVEEMIDFYEYDPSVKPFADTEEVFQLLKEKGVRIALNTGFPRIIAETIVNRFQWTERGLIDDLIASDEVKDGRPAPLMIEQLMFRAGIDDPMMVAKVGDTTVDIEEGRAAGCFYIISVTTGSGTVEELAPFSPTHIVNNLTEVFEVLSKN